MTGYNPVLLCERHYVVFRVFIRSTIYLISDSSGLICMTDIFFVRFTQSKFQSTLSQRICKKRRVPIKSVQMLCDGPCYTMLGAYMPLSGIRCNKPLACSFNCKQVRKRILLLKNIL